MILGGDKGHRLPLKTEKDWIRAGEMVFDSSPQTGAVLLFEQVRDPEWWAKVRPPIAKDTEQQFQELLADLMSFEFWQAGVPEFQPR